ncbi:MULTISPECIES: class I SAM-dependent methyltransferase [Prochlorococcus]|uniref:class I SAM-dependent methyltransferase n=1 Tax=Prochlorococcus TaxID=1218 RepID=UPI000533A79A|nr:MULTISPECIES: class I SAM-dependent methyltransferase [Prochlorococcus]KGG12568.1 SAM-dependent methyltransferase [Prochlorococcus sp. MIT 0601]
MNSPLNVKAYSEADFSIGDKKFVSDIEKYICRFGKQICVNNVIVDLGCGPGNITERVSLKWPMAKVIGIDGSQEMIDVAIKRKYSSRENKRLSGMTYIKQNISEMCSEGSNKIPFANFVISNSLLHHMHNPSNFWEAIKRISFSGSLQVHRDLRRPSSAKEVLALQRKYLPKAPQVLIDDYHASLYAAFTVSEVKDQLKIAGLDHLKVFELNDRYLEIVGIC